MMRPFAARDGTVFATLPDVFLPAGRLRQFLPEQAPLPASGVASGFNVEIQVTAGTALTAAQVVDTTPGAPAYFRGVRR